MGYDSNTNKTEEGGTRLRPSSLQEWYNCRYKFYLKNILGERGEVLPNYHLRAGSSLHKGAEVGYLEKIKTKKLPPLSVVQDGASDEFDEFIKQDDLVLDDTVSVGGLKDLIMKGTKTYFYEGMTKTNPSAVEISWTKKLDHPIFDEFGGTADIIEEADHLVGKLPVIADIKFIGRKTSPEKYILQQSAYSYLRNGVDKVGPSNIFIHAVTKKTNVLHIGMIKPNEVYLKHTVNDILQVTKEFHKTGNENLFSGSSPHSNFLCNDKYCPFWSMCKFVKGI